MGKTTKRDLDKLQEVITQTREDKVRSEKDVEAAKKKAKEAKEKLTDLGVTPGGAQKKIEELGKMIQVKTQAIRDTIQAIREEVL